MHIVSPSDSNRSYIASLRQSQAGGPPVERRATRAAAPAGVETTSAAAAAAHDAEPPRLQREEAIAYILLHPPDLPLEPTPPRFPDAAPKEGRNRSPAKKDEAASILPMRSAAVSRAGWYHSRSIGAVRWHRTGATPRSRLSAPRPGPDAAAAARRSVIANGGVGRSKPSHLIASERSPYAPDAVVLPSVCSSPARPASVLPFFGLGAGRGHRREATTLRRTALLIGAPRGK
jgi:hypothetical protein